MCNVINTQVMKKLCQGQPYFMDCFSPGKQSLHLLVVFLKDCALNRQEADKISLVPVAK